MNKSYDRNINPDIQRRLREFLDRDEILELHERSAWRHFVLVAQQVVLLERQLEELRKGTEVLLSFIDGDPDRPIIAGAINSVAAPGPVKPYASPSYSLGNRAGTPGPGHCPVAGRIWTNRLRV